jgi:Rieske Fe-S protein
MSLTFVLLNFINKKLEMKNFRILGFFAFALFVLASCGADKAGTAAPDTTATPVSNQAATTPATTTPVTTPEVPVGPLTTVEFEETTYDYGEIMEGEKVVHNYKFTNTGKEPLIISNAKGSCGCTVPDWPREPIAPGASSEIKVQFDSKGKGKVEGAAQSKRVTITANTDPANSYLTIKGTVKKDAAAAAPAVQ